MTEMYATDIVLLSLAILLIILPFTPLVLPFEKFSLSHVISAISAITVISLAWGIIRSRRQDSLRRLFQYRLNVEEYNQISETSFNLKDAVERNHPIETEVIESLNRLLGILKTHRWFMKIDQLIPCKIIWELAKLVDMTREYNRELQEFDKALEDKASSLLPFKEFAERYFPKVKEKDAWRQAEPYAEYQNTKNWLKEVMRDKLTLQELELHRKIQLDLELKEYQLNDKDLDRVCKELKGTVFLELKEKGYWERNIIRRIGRLETMLNEFKRLRKPFAAETEESSYSSTP